MTPKEYNDQVLLPILERIRDDYYSQNSSLPPEEIRENGSQLHLKLRGKDGPVEWKYEIVTAYHEHPDGDQLSILGFGEAIASNVIRVKLPKITDRIENVDYNYIERVVDIATSQIDEAKREVLSYYNRIHRKQKPTP